MKLIYSLPLLSILFVSALGEENLRGLAATYDNIKGVKCNKSCMEDIKSCDKKCDVSSSGITQCKKGKLPKKCKKECCGGNGGNNTYRQDSRSVISGVKCDKDCMEDIKACDKKCNVGSNGSTECKKGKLPNKCKKECCDGVGGVKSASSFSGVNVRSGGISIKLSFPSSDVSGYLDDAIDALENLIAGGNNSATSKSDLKKALKSALRAVSDEVEESLENLEKEVEGEIEAVSDEVEESLENLEKEVEGEIEDLEDEIDNLENGH